MFRSSISLLILVAAASTVQAQDDEENPFRPGLIATYTAGGISATRTDEVIAFDWQEAAPEARLPAGEFTAKWTGRLMTQTSGAYRLHCYVQGEVEIKLAGQQVLVGRSEEPDWIASQPLEYGFDRHELAITFRKTSPQARLALFWSGPDFRLEPIGERFLMHDRPASPSTAFERGRQLAAALRCAACHKDEAAKVIPAPALDRLSGNVHEHWLVNWLSSHEHEQTGTANALGHQQPLRRMPDLRIKPGEAEAIAAWLLREPAVKAEQKKVGQKEAKVAKEGEKKGKKAKGEKGDEKPKPFAEEGERIILSRGCLACHQFGPHGESGVFGGGTLNGIILKRPGDFLLRWLENPAAINRSHRMPVFSLTRDEQESLKLWQEEAWKQVSPWRDTPKDRASLVREGEKHVAAFRCANCHLVSRDKSDLVAAFRPPLTAASDWVRSCSGQPEREKGRPGYHLAAEDQEALKAYYSQARPGEGKLPSQTRGRDLLVQLNCLACHQREGVDRTASLLPARLQDKLTAVAEAHDELAPLVPAMTPPALNSVGDKLHDAALADSIRRKGDPHRPYLLVQMPKFDLTDEQLGHLTAYFTATDRIPGGIGVPPVEEVTAGETPAPRLLAAGPRLVTADGLACASCHQVGSVMPSKAPLNARGPTLSMLEKRIRKEWFDRWCDNPARIVPRMEMPSVKVPVRGVLNEKIDDQLAAVWHTLNTPGFEPPEPNPVRVLRLSGVPEKNERPIVIHDVFKDGDKTWLYPLVIGLPNRHNILFDLETNRLAGWWLGDTARQRTRGKYWFWEPGAKPILELSFAHSEVSIVLDGKEYFPDSISQSKAQLSGYEVGDNDVKFTSQLRFSIPNPASATGLSRSEIGVYQRLYPWSQAPESGMFRDFRFEGSRPVPRIRVRLVDTETAHGAVSG